VLRRHDLAWMLLLGACANQASPGDSPAVGVSRSAILGEICSVEAEVLQEAEDPDVDPPMPSEIFQVTNTTGLVAALDDAVAVGEGVIVLQNGTYGAIELPTRPEGDKGWIVIIGCSASYVYAPSVCPSMPDPPEPTLTKRIADADVVPVFQTSTGPAIQNQTSTGSEAAHHYQIIGVEAAATQALTSDAIISFTRDSDGSLKSPHHIKLDRVFVHGSATLATKRGVEMNGNHMIVVRSRITDIHRTGQEAQGINVVEGSGPYTFQDNYIAASTENILIGGGNAPSATDIPASVRIIGNHLHKPDEWRAHTWMEKNLLELKNVNGAVIEHNLLEGSWYDPSGQRGFAVVFTPRNTGAPTPTGPDDDFTTVRNVWFRNNKVDRAAGGINILGSDDLELSDISACIEINNNLFRHIGDVTSTVANAEISGTPNYSFDSPTDGAQPWIQVIAGPDPDTHDNGVSDLTVQHNTAENKSHIVYAALSSGATDSLNEDFAFLDNAIFLGGGFLGDGTSDATTTLDTYFTGTWTWSKNGIATSGSPSGFPSGTLFESASAAFTSTLSIKSTSSFHHACSHAGAHDLGVLDFSEISIAEDAADDSPL
jgi:hypothetical protein